MKLRARRAMAYVLCVIWALLSGVGFYNFQRPNTEMVGETQKTEEPKGDPKTGEPEATAAPTAVPTPVPPPEHDEIRILLPGEEPAHWDEVCARFEELSRETVNLTLNSTFIPEINYQESLLLQLASQTSYDMVYDAYKMGLESRIAQGAYHRLDDMLRFEGFTGLREALPEAALQRNRVGGGNYTIPLLHAQAEVYGVAIRSDFREDFALPEIGSIEDLEGYFAAALKKKSNVSPLIVNASKDGSLMLFERAFREKREKDRIFSVPLSEYFWADVRLSEDPKSVEAVSIADFKRANLTKFPESYSYFGKDDAGIAKSWNDKGYTGFSSATSYDKWEAFYGGKAAAIVISLSEYPAVARTFALRNPDARCEFFVADDDIRALKPGSVQADGRALGHLAVPVSSQKASRVVSFYDWIVGTQENHDLFAYGIEGKDWVASGNEGWKRPNNVVEKDSYFLPENILTSNAIHHRTRSDLPTDITKLDAFVSDAGCVAENPLAGFTFDTRPVGDQVYRLGPSVRYALVTLSMGQILGRYDEVVVKIDQKMREFGDREELREEVKRQVDAFLSGDGMH